MYAGVIEGIAHATVLRFAMGSDAFLPIVTSIRSSFEPGRPDSNEIYPNGISTSLPFDVQMQIVRSMQGMENAKIVRPVTRLSNGFDPRDLKTDSGK